MTREASGRTGSTPDDGDVDTANDLEFTTETLKDLSLSPTAADDVVGGVPKETEIPPC
jgi:hypothetical protein